MSLNLEHMANTIYFMCIENKIDISNMLNDIGLSDDFVSDIMNGYSPSVSTIYAIAEYLDCSIDYLCGYRI